MKIRVSIVIFKPDVGLLIDVVEHLSVASARLQTFRACQVHLDIINNDPGGQKTEGLAGLLQNSAKGQFKVCLADSPGNIGYGAANNISIREGSDATYHLVLNPDALLEPDALAEAVNYMEDHQGVGLLVPKVLGFDGETHHLCKLNPSLFDMFLRGFAPRALREFYSERMDRFLMLDRDYDQVISPVYYPSGCCMFFRGDLLRRIGGFDERFFMYLEDADIGRRILEHAGVAYVPSVVIRHKWTRGTHNNWRLRWATVVSALQYWWKWGGVFAGTT